MKTNRIARVAIALLPFSVWSALREGKQLATQLQSKASISKARLVTPGTGSVRAVKSNAPYTGSLDNGKPLFILHIGPPKTGTTSLQYYAGDHQDDLQQDNIHYLGQYKPQLDMRIHELPFACIMEHNAKCQAKWQDLERKVELHRQQNHTVFMSEENFILQDEEGVGNEHLWQHLEPMLSKWNVRIIVTYRKYYEYLPSQYFQIHNPNGYRGQTKKRFLQWPEGKRRMIPTFRAFFQQHMDSNFSLLQEVRLWKSKFPNDVRVLNMHDESRETVQQLFCDAIPEAKRLCLLVSGTSKFLTKNSSAKKYVHFDRIAMEAYQEGLVKEGLNRTHVKGAVEEHARANGLVEVMDFPYICLNKNQSANFLKLSLDYEAELLPELRGEALKSDYKQAMEVGSFCSVDTKVLLKDKQWQQFFETLGAEAIA